MKNESLKKSLEESKKVLEEKRKIVKRKICIKKDTFIIIAINFVQQQLIKLVEVHCAEAFSLGTSITQMSSFDLKLIQIKLKF